MDRLNHAWELFTSEHVEEAGQMFQEVLANPGTSDEQGRHARFGLGYCLAFTNHFAEARAEFAGLREDAQMSGDCHAEHRALHQVGMVERMAGNWAAAQTCFEEEQGLIASLGNQDLPVSVNAYELAQIALYFNQPDPAKSWLETCLNSAIRSKDMVAVGCAYRGLGEWHQQYGARSDTLISWRAAAGAFAAAQDEQGLLDMERRIAALPED